MYVFFIVLCSCMFLLGTADETRTRTVESKAGRITGKLETIQIGPDTAEITKFLGIPYAEPPVGSRRFAKPVPRKPFTNTFSALEYGASCPQVHFMYTPKKMDENCLFLNIFTPDITGNDEKLPVMFWIHGGGFIFGDGIFCAGDRLSAYGKVVVVTMNYRLGPLGFLNTGDGEVDANNGLRDQHLAIRWVKENIESFGGDSSRITIFGESAGGASVSYQVIYPGNEGLFQRAIHESGDVHSFWAFIENPAAKAKALASMLNCPDSPTSDMVKCLRGFDNATHITVVSNLEGGAGLHWSPSYDKDFVLKEKRELLKYNKDQTTLVPFSNIDVMIGTTDYDGQVLLEPYGMGDLFDALINETDVGAMTKINERLISRILQEVFKKDIADEILDAACFLYVNYDDPKDRNLHIKQSIDLFTDIAFFVAASMSLDSHVFYRSNNARTYQYQFAERHAFQKAASWLNGALHADETVYLFGFAIDIPKVITLKPEQEVELWPLASIIMDYWTNFAKTGNPNLPRTPVAEWKEYNAADKSYLRMTSGNFSNLGHLNAMRKSFWTKYIPNLIRKLTAGDQYSRLN